MYRIEYDELEQIITATLDGFWTIETVARYSADLLAFIEKVRARRNFARLLARSSGMVAQSTRVSEKFGELSQKLSEVFPGPVAIIAGSTLNKMQATRVFAQDDIRVFMDEAQARAWLMSVRPN